MRQIWRNRTVSTLGEIRLGTGTPNRGVFSMRVAVLCVLGLILTGGSAFAQSRDAMSKSVKQLYDGMRRNITEAAEQVPESQYGFKPTPEVRSFGQLVGHIAGSQFFFCSAAKGEKNPTPADYENDVTDKAGLVVGLKASNVYCDGVYAELTDASAAEMVAFGRGEVTRMYTLVFNVAHDNEHYGNMVTYMRLKGMVPPSTARGQ